MQVYISGHISRAADRIRRRSSRDSIAKIDLLRVFGMFLIVYAHITGHGMRLFGVAPVSSVYVIGLFIFCAGYFYKPEADHTRPLTFLSGRAKAYLLPYFLWNLVYGVICTALKALGIIGYGNHLSFYTLFLSPWKDAEQFEFNYAGWFLLSLFLVVMVTWGIRYLISRIRPMNKLSDHGLLAVFFLLSMLAIHLLGQGQYHYGWEIAVLRPMVLLPWYQMGYVYRTYWENTMDRWFFGPILAAVQAILCLMSRENLQAKMVYGYFVGNPVLLALTAAIMILLLSWTAGWLGKVLHGKALKFTSHCTMYIMLHHLFWLFLLHMGLWLLDHFLGLPGFSSSAFHTDRWYIYTPFGSPTLLIYVALCYALPVLFHWIYEKRVIRLAGKRSSEQEAVQ